MTKPIDTAALDGFLTKVRQAARMGSKEIRLSITDGADFAASVGQLMARNIALEDELRSTRELVGKTIRIDGGSFE